MTRNSKWFTGKAGESWAEDWAGHSVRIIRFGDPEPLLAEAHTDERFEAERTNEVETLEWLEHRGIPVVEGPF